MFRQLKEKNKNLLRLKLKSALKIEQITVVLQMKFILNRKSFYKEKSYNSYGSGYIFNDR